LKAEYTTGAQEQLYIENNGVIAVFDREQGNYGVGSLQCPLLCTQGANGVVQSAGREKFGVVQAETGGAFGGKRLSLDNCGHAALLAMKSGRPDENRL